ncbi:hypothetical protein PRVXH_002482 [Proteinivorax hydrogeniformans]|uniref:Spore coat protein n=1 Tax=Proteinivorax hydrogeniformans TaxID=1826727 RepID=A0AAU8HSH0_9FIRM
MENSKEQLKEKLKDFGPNKALVEILVSDILKKNELTASKADKLTEEQKEQIRQLALEYLDQLGKLKEQANKGEK